VTLLLPTLDGKSFYGGTATALVVAGRIAQLKKRKLRIVQTLKTGHASNLSAFFKREGLDFPEEDIKVISVADRAYNVYGYISMHPEDIFVASAWWDAKLISRLPLKHKFIYLIQDFEPIFYNNSDQYVLAESTYENDTFVPLCNTQLMADFMKAKKYPSFVGKSPIHFFEPAVSRTSTGYVTKKETGEKKRLFLYGRPDVHRNLFFTALQSIDAVFRDELLDKSEWEIHMAGQDNLPDVALPSGVKVRNLGKMSMEDYIAFSKSVDIAVSPMMAPHPNYPTLEFASIGTAVVTTQYENKKDLSNYSKNIFTVKNSVEEIAKAIVKAAKMSHKQRVENAKNGSISTSWQESIDDAVAGVLKAMK
jgi:glycosyltransferase involved in cell wall biosynthesis